MAQPPPEHVGVAWGSAGHGMAQAPQLATSPRTSISQPVLATPSQSANPMTQSPMVPHTPAVQVATTFAGGVQALPHVVQLAGSLARSVSQPSETMVLQSSKPAWQ